MRANAAVACVVRAVRRLGLEVAPQKTEAVFFHDGSRGASPPTRIVVGTARPRIGAQIKYLGLTLDGGWTFRPHFAGLAPRAETVPAMLGRILPNLGGPDGRVRRLYVGVVHSVILCGSPVWAGRALADRRIRDQLRRIQRKIASRVARTYRTVSHVAVTALAGIPPVDLLASMHAEVYWRKREIRERGGSMTARDLGILKVQARRSMMAKWGEMLENPDLPGQWTVEAIRPCLLEWVDRARGGLSFHLTQVLSGHGCFGDYLCRIGRAHCKVPPL